MKKYFYDTISRCFDNAIYTAYGPVAVDLVKSFEMEVYSPNAREEENVG